MGSSPQSSACIFISYSSRDAEVAAALEAYLRGAGFEVWRDTSRLETDWSAEIAQALADKADALCLLWSEHAANSKYVQHEWLTARAIEKLIVPCLLPGAPDLPEPLRTLQRCDSWEQAAERFGSATSLHLRYVYTALPPNVYIPFSPNPSFQGRESDLVELYLAMVGNLSKVGINQVGIVGMAGVGKTQLAVEFAYRFSFAFDGIFWIQAADPDTWLRQFVGVARDALQLTIPHTQGPEINSQYLLALQRYCKAHPQTLIIMDNVQHPKLLASEGHLLGVPPLAMGANLLFTTRRHFDLPGVTERPVDILRPDAAYALLTCARQPATPQEEQSGAQICSATGNLPLALALIAAFLKKRRLSYTDYCRELESRGLGAIDLGKVSAEELATRHRAAVSDTLREQWELLDSADARLLFQLAGQFPESVILPKARLGLLAGIDAGASVLDQPLEEAFLALDELNLVETLEDDTVIRLHPLVRDFAGKLVAEHACAAFRGEAAHRLNMAYAGAARLEREYSTRKVDAVIEDLQVAIDWSEAGSSTAKRLELLRSVVDRERHHLRRGAPLFQQLHHRACNMGLQDLAAHWWHATQQPAFRSVAVSATEDPAWIRTFAGHASTVTAVAFSRDGRRALSGSADRALMLWDVGSGSVLRRLHGHSNAVIAVSLSADARRALSCSSEGTLTVWDVESGEALRRSESHSNLLTAVGLSADRQLMLSGYENGALFLFDVESDRALSLFEGHSAAITALSMSTDGQWVLSGSRDGTLILWDLVVGQAVRRLEGHRGPVHTVSLDGDGRHALSASEDDTVILWDLTRGVGLRRFEHAGSVTTVSLSPDGRWALTGSDDRALILWDVKSARTLRLFDRSSGVVTAISMNGDGRRVLTYSGALMLWDTESGVALRQLVGFFGLITAASLSADERRALTGSLSGALALWNVESGLMSGVLQGHSDIVRAVSLSPDGGFALSSSDDKTLILWDVERGVAERRFAGHSDRILAAIFSGDGRQALSGSTDNTLILWDVATGAAVRRFHGHSGWVTAVSLTPDGRQALSGSEDNTLILWNVASGNSLQRIEAHESGVSAVVLSPDGRRALSGSRDKTVALWNLETGHQLARLFLQNPVTRLAWAGSRIVAGDDTGILYFLAVS